ncbi:terminase [bacterium]|nr:terminase [bacterium]
MLSVFVQALGIGYYWAGDKVLELKDPERGEFWAGPSGRSTDSMWGRIILRSASSPGGLESATAKAAIVDEAGQDEFTLEAWEAIMRRLSLSQGRVLIGTTPYNLGWLKTEVYDRWKEGDTDYDVIQFASTMNPVFPQAELERARRTMPDWRYRMFYLGQFTRPAGLIYGDFTDQMLVDPFPIPLDWPRVVGVDFGGANTATLALAQAPDETWYCYHESLAGDMTTREHAQRAMELVDGCEDVEYVGGAPGETQQRADWTAEGVWVQQPRVSDVESGIDRVITLIKSGKFRVFRTLKGTRDELARYKRKLDQDGNTTEKIEDKSSFHRLDCLRYACTKIVKNSMNPEDLVAFV